jgi:hypothetical protein
MESAAQSNDLPKDTMFRPAGGVFKLIPPPHPANNKFKPSGAREVSLAPVAPTTPTEFGHLGVPKVAVPPAPPAPPAVQPTPSPALEGDDGKIIARMQKLLSIEKRAAELEEENDVLIKIVNRLKAENAALRAK